MNSIHLNSKTIKFNIMQRNSCQLNSLRIMSMQVNSLQFNPEQCNSNTFKSIQVQLNSSSAQSISIQCHLKWNPCKSIPFQFNTIRINTTQFTTTQPNAIQYNHHNLIHLNSKNRISSQFNWIKRLVKPSLFNYNPFQFKTNYFIKYNSSQVHLNCN